MLLRKKLITLYHNIVCWSIKSNCTWVAPSMYNWSLQWRHNECDGISNHQPHDCLLNCISRCGSKKTSKLHVTGLSEGIHWWPVNSPHNGPVTREMFPFECVFMWKDVLGKQSSSSRQEMSNHRWLLELTAFTCMLSTWWVLKRISTS